MIDQLFANARAEKLQTPVVEVSETELMYLARAYFHRLEANVSPVPLDEDDRLASERSNFDDLRSVSQDEIDVSIQAAALSAAKWAKVSVLVGTPAFNKLCTAIQHAEIEHYARQANRLALQPPGFVNPMFADVSASSPPKSRLTLAKAVTLYKDAPERSGVSDKTRASDTFRFAALMDLLGPETLVASLTRDDIRKARDILVELPPNAPKRFRGMPLAEVAKLAAERGLSPMAAKSAGLYIECLSALFSWLVQEELTARNPAKGLKGPPALDSTRRPFTVSELNALFAADPFNGKGQRSWQFWLPRVALFTGMRLAELAGLKAEDIRIVDGTPFFNVAPNEHRSLKTKGSRRLVPMHSALRALGLAQHALSLPQGGLLFPDIPPSKVSVAQAAQKVIGRNIRKVHTDPDLVFHSFRHTFRDAEREAGMPQDIAAAMGGWDVTGKSAMDDYGRGHREWKLAEWMEKISYSGLILDPR